MRLNKITSGAQRRGDRVVRRILKAEFILKTEISGTLLDRFVEEGWIGSR